MIDHCQMDADPNDASITELYGGASTARQSPVIEAPQAGCTRHWEDIVVHGCPDVSLPFGHATGARHQQTSQQQGGV